MHHQLRRMALIYQGASLTIIAANGDDANYGICGLRGISEPRILPPALKQTDEISITLSSTALALQKSAWAQRAWTLQELLFSTWMLIFVDDTVWWAGSGEEYAAEELSGLHPVYPTGIRSHSNFTNSLELCFVLGPHSSLRLETLETYINIFNVRDLSFDTDVIPASLSVPYTLRPKFPRGFIYGHPISFLDATLIWRSNTRNPFHRRSSVADNPVPPSWSWAGWKGGFSPIWSTSPLEGNSIPLQHCAGTVGIKFPNARDHPLLTVVLADVRANKRSVDTISERMV